MVELWCALVGKKGSAFSIDIEASKSVDHLKDAIAGKQRYDFAASKLELYLAKKGDAWLTENEVKHVTDTSGLKHLTAARAELDVVGLSEEDVTHEIDKQQVAAGNGRVNVLVVIPEDIPEPSVQPNKRIRLEHIYRLNDLVTIAQQLNDATVGAVLDIPTTIFGTAIPNGFYIRQEYWDLHDLIKQRLSSDRSLRRILVVGSPGIGKSVFGLFLLLLFMTERKDIAYHPIGRPITYYFTWNNTNYQISGTPLPGRTYDGLFDGNENGGALDFDGFNHAYLFASPRTTNSNEFVKELCLKVYMNPWTKAECQSFADAIHFDEDEWIRRYNLVGGKPRFLFSSSETFERLVKRVSDEIPHNLDHLKDQVRLFEESVFDDRMKHIVFNLYRDEVDPSISYLTYSSLAVEAIVGARYDMQSADEIRALLQTPAANLQSWRGREIEKFLLQDLATRSFCMRALEGRHAGSVTHHGPLNATSAIIHASSEIQNELLLHIPLSKSFPAIDGVLVVPGDRRIIYAQSTVGSAHPIKYQPLKEVYQHLMQRQEFQGYEHILLFIVSNDIYDHYTVQPYKNADGKKRTARIDINVTQYVGKITRQ